MRSSSIAYKMMKNVAKRVLKRHKTIKRHKRHRSTKISSRIFCGLKRVNSCCVCPEITKPRIYQRIRSPAPPKPVAESLCSTPDTPSIRIQAVGYTENHYLPLGQIKYLKPTAPPTESVYNDKMSPKNRDLLVHWIYQGLHELPKCYPFYAMELEATWLPVFWSSVWLFHDYMRIKQEKDTERWQLIVSTCLFICLKLYGHLFTIDSINYFNDEQYSNRAMQKKEIDILETVQYNLRMINPCDFLSHMLQKSVCGDCYGNIKDASNYTNYIDNKVLQLTIATTKIVHNRETMDKYTAFDIAAAVLLPNFVFDYELLDVNQLLDDAYDINEEELVRIRQCKKELTTFNWKELLKEAKKGKWAKLVSIPDIKKDE